MMQKYVTLHNLKERRVQCMRPARAMHTLGRVGCGHTCALLSPRFLPLLTRRGENTREWLIPRKRFGQTVFGGKKLRMILGEHWGTLVTLSYIGKA